MSDSGKAFGQALAARGYTLAQGDRRGHVAVDYRGEVYAIARYVGVKANDTRDKLGKPGHPARVDQAKQQIAARMTEMLLCHIRVREAEIAARVAATAARKRDIVLLQRQQRADLDKAQAARQTREAQERTKRLTKGLRGLWDRLTGKHARVRQQNERETSTAHQRDRSEKDTLIFGQLDERRALHRDIKEARQRHAGMVAKLHSDIAAYGADGDKSPHSRQERHLHDKRRSR